MYKFSLRVMSKEKKKYFAFAVTMLILTTVEFLFFELVNHSLITTMNADDRITFSILSLMIITFSFFITFYVNSQYIDYKRRELGILYLSGRNLIDISKYLLVQYLVIFVVVIPIGIFIACLLLPLFYSFINQQFNAGINIFQYNSTGILETVVFILTKIIYIIIINIGFTYRNEIIEIMNRTDKKKNKQMLDTIRYGGGASIKVSMASFGMIGMDPKERQKIVSQGINESISKIKAKKENKTGIRELLFSLISIIAYIGTLVLMIINNFEDGSFTGYTYINIVALLGIINFAIPYFIGKNNNFIRKNPVRFIVYNDSQLMLKGSTVPVSAIAMILPVVVSIVSFNLNDNLYRMIALFGYIVLTVILAGCLYFKNIVYITGRDSEFKSLAVMGYHEGLIKKIINREVIYHFIIAAFLPLLAILIQIYKSYVFGGLSLVILTIMVISYILTFFIAFILTLVSFRRRYAGRQS